ncbi:MAG TPA: tripartite tricarboxylate transporter substrate binding protein [Burkholderiales bacterium]|nr:tripartite tricarboxylate transporter substrate binding protein [Burkholderiales bacterium]
MKRFFLLAMAALLPSLASAQDYPNRAIKIIIPFPPGGPTDLLGRAIAQGLSEAWGQPVIAENKPGAAGNLGVDLAAKSPADGYTLAVVPAGNISVNPTLFPKLPYKQSDLAPITMLATVENVLVVHPGVPAKNMAELVALARAKPGSITFASPGAGAQAHLLGEMLSVEAGVQLVHVPYKGLGPALNDLLGGQVSMMFPQTSSALPHIQAGKLRAIGVTSLKRSQVLPETPTLAEQGYLKIDAKSWYALMAPAGVPKEIINKLSQECARILRRPDVKERLAGLGADVVGGTPEELAAVIQAETALWGGLIRRQGIKVE